MTVYDQTSRRSIKRFAVCGKCGSRQFVLNKDQVALSNWSFSCANCGTKNPDPWVEKCDETLSRIAATIGPGGNIVGEASMEKINYAASSAYFVKSDTFITFPEGSGIEALEPGQAYLLPGVVERLVGLEGPPLSDADVNYQLTSKERAAEAKEFGEIHQAIKSAEDSNNTLVVDLMNKMKAERLANWQQAGWLQRDAALPATSCQRCNCATNGRENSIRSGSLSNTLHSRKPSFVARLSADGQPTSISRTPTNGLCSRTRRNGLP